IFEGQALAGTFLHMTIDHTRKRRRLTEVVVVTFQYNDLVCTPVSQLERTRSSIAGLQERVTEIGVILVIVGWRDSLRLFHHELFIDNCRNGCGQNVEHEAWSIGLVDRKFESAPVQGLRFFSDIIPCQTELSEQKG